MLIDVAEMSLFAYQPCRLCLGESPIPRWVSALLPSCGRPGANMWPGVSAQDAEQWWRCPGSRVPFKRHFCASRVFTLPSVFAPAHFQAGSSALILFRLFSFLPPSLSLFLSFFTALDTFFFPCSTYPSLLSIARTLEPCVAEGMSDSELRSIFV